MLPRPSSRAAVVLLPTAVVLLGLAARADSASLRGRPWLAVLDLAVGLVWVVGAGGAAGRQALAAWSVGAAWWLGSITPAAVSWHQGLLVLVLVGFPSRRLRGPVDLGCVVAGGALGVGLLSQPATAVTLLAVSVSLVARPGVRRTTFPVAAAAALASAVAFSWWATRSAAGVPTVPLAYFAAVGVIGLAHPFAVRQQTRRAAGTVLPQPQAAGVAGLEGVLRALLHDPGLQVQLRRDGDGPWVPADVPHPVVLTVDRQARLRTASRDLDSGTIREGVREALRLSLEHDRLRALAEVRLADLRSSALRLSTAADRERALMTERLRAELSPSLQAATAAIRTAEATADSQDAAALRVADQELTAVQADVDRLVAGTAASALGGGRLAAVLQELADRSPLPVRLDWAADAVAEPAVESSLFYVVSEALANAVKHAGGSCVRVTGRLLDEALVVTVTDDGRGGADAQGAGLRGLADRLAVLGGRLTVADASPHGTAVRAEVPTGRPAAP